jgi:hypothetical protein
VEKLKTKEKHGMTKTSIYRVWADMKNRCYNPNIKNYSIYGARGISVCDKWFNSFIEFYNDVGNGYSVGLQIDRVDVNGNYCKENCRWVTPSINSINKRKKANGVQLDRNNKKFVARITADNGSYNIGSFNSKEEAHDAYLKMKMEWYGF